MSFSKFSPEKVRVIVFDVDNTVTRGTTELKKQTWEALFADKLNLLQEARVLYEYTGNGDRYNMIAHVIEESQENCRENKTVIEWADRFEKIIQEKIRKNGIHVDDVEALLLLRKRFSGSIYLLSATPISSVSGNMEHFEKRYPEIKGMFKKIVGTPMNGGKAGELVCIAGDNGCSTDEILMIGDGRSDYCGAFTSGSQFIGVLSNENRNDWEREVFPKVSNIVEVTTIMNL